MLESVFAVVGRLIPYYTRNIKDPRRSVSLLLLYVFCTHIYVNSCKFIQFCGFYTLFIKQCHGQLESVVRTDSFLVRKKATTEVD
jgi:hypothetical protein